MRYLPHTLQDIKDMLHVIGAESLDSLFVSVPNDCRRSDRMALPDPLSEWELNAKMADLAKTVAVFPDYQVFLGAGSYDHFIPHTIPYLTGRSEFCTSYTPYQPEISQGTLQAIFEYQTLISRLFGMDLSNASLYDGASALAEAILMAIRITGRRKIGISILVHPYYRQVVQTYLRPTDCKIVELAYLPNGRTDPSAVVETDDMAAVVIQSPNFFGCIEQLDEFGRSVHEQGGLLLACFSEPIAYGMLKSPGSLGADIVCGEGQSFGLATSFGGPGLGVLTCRKEFMRNMPGRLVGMTTDKNGKQGFVLTLATREQHIRREKATSNICTNSNLCAVTAAMFLASLGGAGLHQLAGLNHDKAEYLKKALLNAGVTILFESPTFNEFVVQFPSDTDTIYQKLLERRIIAGLPLSAFLSGA